MEKLNWFNENSNQLSTDIHNVYKLPSNKHEIYLKNVNSTFSYVFHNYIATQHRSYKFPCNSNNNFGMSNLGHRENYLDFYIDNPYENSSDASKRHKSQQQFVEHKINYADVYMKKNCRDWKQFNIFTPMSGNIAVKKDDEYFHKNIFLEEFTDRKHFYKQENKDVYHFYSRSNEEKQVTGTSIREFLSSWNDDDDDYTTNSNNHPDQTKPIKINVKQQILNHGTKKTNKLLSASKLSSSFKNLIQKVLKINLEQLSNILRTNKRISYARHLIKKYKNKVKHINKRQKLILNTIKDICKSCKTIKKPHKTTHQILKYFINKLKMNKQKPTTLLSICKRILSHHYNIKIIPSLSNLNKIIVKIEDNDYFKGLEPVCYYTEVFEESSAWFRKNLLKEKYKNKLLISKKPIKKMYKHLKHCKSNFY